MFPVNAAIVEIAMPATLEDALVEIQFPIRPAA
jgi:hypothetical protein